ncbi:MAG: hypothetical protein IJQ95_03765 [Paludibacteraceae bacterium]|nr:hypothetical protein [Paludibacteraceae bacterium]
MTNSQKRLARRIGWTMFNFGFIILMQASHYIIDKVYGQPIWALGVLLILTIAWFVMIGTQEKKQIDYIPNESESSNTNQPLSQVVEFKNSFDWWRLVGVITTLVLLYSIYYIFDTMRLDMSDYIILIVMFLSIAIVSLIFPMRNKYIIDGNVFIAQEYSFLKPMTEIRIPIAEIEHIRIQGIASGMLVLVVNGVERKLLCSMRIEEIATELYRRRWKQ